MMKYVITSVADQSRLIICPLAVALQIPFLQVRENNWALNYRNKHWFCTYDL